MGELKVRSLPKRLTSRVSSLTRRTAVKGLLAVGFVSTVAAAALGTALTGCGGGNGYGYGYDGTLL